MAVSYAGCASVEENVMGGDFAVRDGMVDGRW